MAYEDDIAFVLSEYARFASLGRGSLSQMSITEVFSTLPHPSGHGFAICGGAAQQRIHDLAELALSRDRNLAGRIDVEAVVHDVKKVIVQRFLVENRELNNREAQKAVSYALRSASRVLKNTTHLIPCHLGKFYRPTSFVIGPVTFKKMQDLMAQLEPAIQTYVEEDAQRSQSGDGLAADLAADARKYYGSFEWVAEILIERCDPSISKRRALRIGITAVDCLHILAGAANSDHMRVGGPGFAIDRRGHITRSSDGRVDVSASVDWLTQSFPNDWWDRVNAGHGAEIVRLMGLALETGYGLPRPAPLAQRFVDAAAWYGEAVRDPFRASRLIKYVTAIERLLITSNKDVAETLATRGAALILPTTADDLQTVKRRFKSVYDLRSDLTHGARSPLDPGLGHGLFEAERLTRSVLCGALMFFREDGLKKLKVEPRKLEEGFTRLISWAEQEAGSRADTDETSD